MIDSLEINLVHLFANSMNIYGDYGNVIALRKRCEWRGISLNIISVNNQSDFALIDKGDLFFFGGGQDNDQMTTWSQIVAQKEYFTTQIQKAVDANKVFLLICGGYQMFGQYFIDGQGNTIPGLGILDIATKSQGQVVAKRCIGNISITTDLPLNPKTIVGFENHGGQTMFGTNSTKDMKYLGKVIKGHGNNSHDGYEGCLYKNVIGSYMHGSLLPKNPHLTDYLITQTLEVKYQKQVNLSPLDDVIEWQAHQSALLLPM